MNRTVMHPTVMHQTVMHRASEETLHHASEEMLHHASDSHASPAVAKVRDEVEHLRLVHLAGDGELDLFASSHLTFLEMCCSSLPLSWCAWRP